MSSASSQPEPGPVEPAAIDIDDQLMIQLQGGETAAFEELVRRHQGGLIGFFYSNTSDLHLAEDLAQETLLRVYDQSWDFLPSGRFRAWLYRVARNLLIDTVRRQSHDALLKAVRGSGDEPSAIASVMAEAVSPETVADQRELAGIVDSLLQELPDEQRLTFVLHHYSGLSLPEVAEVMETSVSTTKSRLRLCREKLQEQLKARGIVPDVARSSQES